MSDKDSAFLALDAFVNNFATTHTKEESHKFLDLVFMLGRTFVNGSELEGDIYLVLDNSVIQDFKHASNNRTREVRAWAYRAFSKFVSEWCSRTTRLGLTPAAVFEHIGRRLPSSEGQTRDSLAEIQALLSVTSLPITPIGFSTVSDLHSSLRDVEADESYLTELLTEIDAEDWNTDLACELGGVRIPLSVAAEALPESMPLKYFDYFSVCFVISGRIEQHIAMQTESTAETPVIRGGPLPELFSKVNKYRRRSRSYSGFGDIDIFQTCDLSRQFQHQQHDGRGDHVLIGMTSDKGLNEVLQQRTAYVLGAELTFDGQNNDAQIKNFTDVLTGKGFAEFHRRGEATHNEFREFFTRLLDILSEVDNSNGFQTA